MSNPEAKARKKIDERLEAAGWQVQDYEAMNPSAGRALAVREHPLLTGKADYLLFVDRRAIGAVEAKPEGTTLSGVEPQSNKYADGLPGRLPAWCRPLPFLYESTGVETFFTCNRDPEPRSRRVFSFHRPETLAAWAREDETLRARLRRLPPLMRQDLWEAQIEAIEGLEGSFADDRPRALIQMATGAGKTFTAVTFVYRLIKFANARRVLFLVDRNNLGLQALQEFQQYVTPDDGRKFSELYNVQHMQSNVLDPVSRVCITTIQRLYSMLAGEEEFDATGEEQSLWEQDKELARQEPKKVQYNPGLPSEYFDFIITDECHRSIYNLWRQVLEYFDAYLIGLTATPSKQTLGFFNQNLVMEYPSARAVLDGVNVGSQLYRIRTEITEKGSTVDAGLVIDKRDRLTRAVRWEQLDGALTYGSEQLDRGVVADDQIRTVVQTFRDRLFSEIYPGRTEVPKTLIFAKDDSHAEDIVRIVREEFGRGNEFCQKITYKVTGVKAEDLIAAFRNSYNPRIAVTVDMVATGTNIKALEIVFFMRAVESRVFFDQMVGRGTRVIDANDLEAVTPGAREKTHFVIVDAVGVTDSKKVETQTLERKRSVPFGKLLEDLVHGVRDEDTLTSLAARLALLGRKLTADDEYSIAATSGGRTLRDLARGLYDAFDPDKRRELAQAQTGREDPGPEALAAAGEELVRRAADPFDAPALRSLLVAIQQRDEQVIDRLSVDRVLEARFSYQEAQGLVGSFRAYLEEHRDEILALQILFSRPYGQQRLTRRQVKELADRLAQPPQAWTTESLWRAYAQLERDKVRGAGTPRVLTDLVSLVRHAVQMDDELVPYPERVRQRYEEWLAAQDAAGRVLSEEQHWWLDQIARHIGLNLEIAREDFQDGELFDRGGWIAAKRAFAGELAGLLEEMNRALVP